MKARKILSGLLVMLLAFSPLANGAERITLQAGSGEELGTATNPLIVQSDGQQIQDKYVTVTTFTAAGINAAIDALGAEGGEVYLPEGDYDITAVITIDQANTTLRGAGKGTRLLASNRFVYGTVTGTPAAGETLTGDTTGYTATVIQVDLVNKIVWYHTISNAANFNSGEVISWSGAADTTLVGAPTEQSFDVIDTNGKFYVTISDLCIYGGSGGGNNENLIGDGDAPDYITIKNCWLYESDLKGITVSTEYGKITNNHVEACDSVAIDISTGSDHAVVTGNTIKDNNGGGIDIRATSATISNNTITNITGTAILVSAGNSNVISGNTILTTTNHGIMANSNHYHSITGNTISDVLTGYKGIYSYRGDYLTITGNNIYGDGTSDIGIQLSDADNCLITGNTTYNHDVAGIDEDPDCVGNMIYNNNLKDTIRSVIEGTLHERLDEHITLADGTGRYNLRDAKAGFGTVLASDGTSIAFFSFTTAGAVTLHTQVNCTTTADNDTTLNIFDNGTDVIIENELGSSLDFQVDINYID